MRLISISTNHELQQQRNISLWCVYHYDDERQPTVRSMISGPSPIGNIIQGHAYTCIYVPTVSVKAVYMMAQYDVPTMSGTMTHGPTQLRGRLQTTASSK